MRGDNVAWERIRRRLCVDAGLDPMSEVLPVLKVEEALFRLTVRQAETYGLLYENYRTVFEQQNGCCAICHREPSWRYPDILVVDHDHSVTDKNVFRGLLCRSCNVGLGHFNDDIQVMANAIAYLQTTPQFAGSLALARTIKREQQDARRRTRQEYKAWLAGGDPDGQKGR